MQVHLDCIPCFALHGVKAARAWAPNDPARQQAAVRTVLRRVAEADFSPAEIAAGYFRALFDEADMAFADGRCRAASAWAGSAGC